MNLSDYSSLLLKSESLKDKLTSISVIDQFTYDNTIDVTWPLRDKSYDFSDKRAKFPKLNQLHLDIPKAKALHFFANHELLAIEMMAAALSFQSENSEDDLKVKKQIIKTISEEQKHFCLYVKKMNELGVEFGDFPNNDYFWRQFKQVKSISQYFALVSLCFEQANLDFAKYYYDFFSKIEDHSTANILNTVLEDEISHVGIGYFWLTKWDKRPLQDFFCDLLPEKVTPARAKGMNFYQVARERANFDPKFIDYMKHYSDSFKVTSRRQWKR